MKDDATPTEEQKTSLIRRKASGYFLIGIGLPVATAFIYPLLGGRRGLLIDFQSLSTSEARVFLIGGAAGIVMTLAGYIILKTGPRP